MVEPMSKAAIAAGSDGLIIEVHNNPKESLCDSEETIDFVILDRILDYVKQ